MAGVSLFQNPAYPYPSGQFIWMSAYYQPATWNSWLLFNCEFSNPNISLGLLLWWYSIKVVCLYASTFYLYQLFARGLLVCIFVLSHFVCPLLNGDDECAFGQNVFMFPSRTFPWMLTVKVLNGSFQITSPGYAPEETIRKVWKPIWSDPPGITSFTDFSRAVSVLQISRNCWGIT